MDEQGGNPPPGSIVLAEATGYPGASQMTCWDKSGGFVYSVGSLIYGGSLVLDPVLQQILRNVLDECLHVHLHWSETVEATVLYWLREGILGIGPSGPVPVPPRGPDRDIWIAMVTRELANQLSSQTARSRLREVSLELIIRSAQQELRP